MKFSIFVIVINLISYKKVMEKMIITLISIMIYLQLAAPPNGAAVIFESEGICPFEEIWNATCQVESSGNRFAIGDNGNSYGIAQIQLSRLNDYFNRTGIRYEMTDMFDIEKSRQIFMFYAGLHGPYQMESIIRSWNAGPRWRNIESTKVYYSKIKKIINHGTNRL